MRQLSTSSRKDSIQLHSILHGNLQYLFVILLYLSQFLFSFSPHHQRYVLEDALLDIGAVIRTSTNKDKYCWCTRDFADIDVSLDAVIRISVAGRIDV